MGSLQGTGREVFFAAEGGGMIVLVVSFISPLGGAAHYAAAQSFPTIAACEAQFARDAASIEAVRVAASADLGVELVVVFRCVARGRPA